MKKRLSSGADTKKKRSKSETPVSLTNMPPIPDASVVESEMESLAVNNLKLDLPKYKI